MKGWVQSDKLKYKKSCWGGEKLINVSVPWTQRAIATMDRVKTTEGFMTDATDNRHGCHTAVLIMQFCHSITCTKMCHPRISTSRARSKATFGSQLKFFFFAEEGCGGGAALVISFSPPLLQNNNARVPLGGAHDNDNRVVQSGKKWARRLLTRPTRTHVKVCIHGAQEPRLLLDFLVIFAKRNIPCPLCCTDADASFMVQLRCIAQTSLLHLSRDIKQKTVRKMVDENKLQSQKILVLHCCSRIDLKCVSKSKEKLRTGDYCGSSGDGTCMCNVW